MGISIDPIISVGICINNIGNQWEEISNEEICNINLDSSYFDAYDYNNYIKSKWKDFPEWLNLFEVGDIDYDRYFVFGCEINEGSAYSPMEFAPEAVESEYRNKRNEILEWFKKSELYGSDKATIYDVKCMILVRIL